MMTQCLHVLRGVPRVRAPNRASSPLMVDATRLRIGGTLLLAGMLVGCAASPPPPTSSHSLTASSGGFLVDGSDAMYTLGCEVTGPYSGNLLARGHFENPTKDGDDLVVEVPLEAGATQFTLQSPALPCVDNGSTYRVRVDLFQDGILVDSISQPLLFNLPVEFLETRGVVRCAAR